MAANCINKKKRHESKLNIKQVFKAPFKFLAGARDFYVKSMMSLDGQMGRYIDDGTICYTYRTHFVDKEGYVEQETVESRTRTGRSRMRGSLSFGIERIDEDKVCEFGEEVMVRTRSSYDVRRRTKY